MSENDETESESETETETKAEAEAEAETESESESGDAVGEPVGEAEAAGEDAKDEPEGEEKSILDTLDLARGEVTDEDLDTLSEAIDLLDFATRKAEPARLERLDAISARLSNLIDQIRRGVRTAQEARLPLTEEQEEQYQTFVDAGVAAGEKGDLLEAAEFLEKAVRLDADGLQALFNLGVVYGLLAHKNIAKMEFYDDYVRDEVFVEKAQICYDAVLALEEDHLPSLNNLATLCSMRDNREAAAVYLRRIVAVEPKTDGERHIVQEAASQLSELESV